MKRLQPIVLWALLLAGCVAPSEVATDLGEPEEGDIVVVPLPEPLFDGNLTPEEWEGGTRIEGEFVIENSTLAAGRYPFTMWLGANDSGLYIGFRLDNMTPNPHNKEMKWYPEVLRFFFTPGREGSLTEPSYFLSAPNVPTYGSVTDGGYWDGSAWKPDEDPARGKFRYNDGKPRGSSLAVGGSTNTTVTWEIYIPREPPNPDRNALDLTRGGIYRMGLGFVRSNGGGDHETAPHDDWPGAGYTPEDHFHADRWAILYLGF